jgi:tRNA nucleotidyltransferase (CCA-adding enzyme)
MQIDLNIQKSFTQDEKELFSILKEVVNKYTPSTKIYLVGGFVRDALMGKKSNDIDVMLSNISGEDFAKLITKHLRIESAHIIQSNPSKSKFITTAKSYIPLSSGTIKEVDFAQARSEVYKENSRIPDIKPATPELDAYRRDLTINSIFYDIINNQIIDFTGKGIKDLITNTIRTPIDPLKTFSDDPLRIWRVVRFSAKYNGNIDPETFEAMKNPQLRDEIKRKVSKERIGAEIEKTLKGGNPEIAIQLLYDTGLMQDIVDEALKGTKYEGKMAQLNMPQNNMHHKLNLWEHTMQVIKNVLDKYPDTEPEKRITIILAALMHDLGKLFIDIQGESKSHPGNKSYHGHEDESKQIAEHILRYLKIEPYIDQTSKIIEHHMRLHQFTEQGQGGSRALRKFLRIMGEQSLNWIDILNLSISDALAKDVTIDPQTVQQYQELENKLQEALLSLKPLQEKNTIKPILNGNEIMQTLNIKPGQHMKEITEFVKELADENPSITKEEAKQKLLEKFQ